MKLSLLILILLIGSFACQVVQTQSNTNTNSANTDFNTNRVANTYNQGEHYGYPRFTVSDKTYLGCWISVKASEVVNYKLRYFQLTEKKIQTSKMAKPISYKENDSNSYKDYFVLKTEKKRDDLQQYLSINIVSNNEMTIHEFATEKAITDGEGEDYFDLKRVDCGKVKNKFKK